ncbi:MAG: alpha/beta fold hydrolase [Proteobacteria bacterium]|nr:alpha/beta fold hydrolase [Pseudomonadota bacterium]
MHVMEAGDPNGRPVLAVHGNPTWGYLYRKIAMELDGSGLRVVMPDIVGLGLSSKPTDPAVHTLENHGRWMGSVVDQLDLNGVVFIGQDWGGPIGLLALEARPERAAGMVILNTVIGPPREGFKATAFHRFANMPIASTIGFRVLGFPQRWLHTGQGDKSSIRGIVKRSYVWPLRKYAERGAPLWLARMVPDSQAHPSIAPLKRTQAFVEGFEGPTAMVWGDRDPVLGKLKRRIHRAMPSALLTETPGGHFLQEEHPVEIAAAVRGVVARIQSD